MYGRYNVNIGDYMNKENAKSIFQLVFSIAVYYIIDNYFFYLLNKIGVNLSGDTYLFASMLRYVLAAIIIYFVYRPNIHASKSRFGRTWVLSVIFSVGAFVLLVFANFILHKLVGIFCDYDGYGFVNYFGSSLSLESTLELITNVILKPFLMIVIFPLGVSNVIKTVNASSVLSGLLYGILIGISLHTSFEATVFTVLVPSLIMMIITYLYKANQNIWMIYVSYVLYIGLGFYVLRYFV